MPSGTDTKNTSAAQLASLLDLAQGESDSKIAGRLSHLKLIERLSAPRRLLLESKLPGIQSRRALTALADESEFVDLLADESPDKAPVSPETQKEILARAAEYLNQSIPIHTNFLATRVKNICEVTPPQVRLGDAPDLLTAPVNASTSVISSRNSSQCFVNSCQANTRFVLRADDVSDSNSSVTESAFGSLSTS